MTELQKQSPHEQSPQEQSPQKQSSQERPALPSEATDGRRATALALPAGLVGATVLVAVGSLWGLWYLPFPCGLLIGAATAVRGLRARTAVLTATVAALVGWGAPLLWRAASGEAVAGTARTVAALAGLPALAALVVAATLLIGLVQTLLGVWLGRTAAAALRPGR
ncbi:hypothetical protein [Kitasatospora sp. NPDC058190]|uniref:hypothetical protein n=1 Tax=Kitasatospora sp. NPDC058190 TaxID=3346371 RepID=UPI0036D91187